LESSKTASSSSTSSVSPMSSTLSVLTTTMYLTVSSHSHLLTVPEGSTIQPATATATIATSALAKIAPTALALTSDEADDQQDDLEDAYGGDAGNTVRKCPVCLWSLFGWVNIIRYAFSPGR
jgi:hypothetical protein